MAAETKRKHALVAGGARGIGAAIVRALVRDGHAVTVADLRSETGEAFAAELRAEGADARFVRCDLSQPESVSALAEALQQHLGSGQRLAAAVNSVGVFDVRQGLLQTTPAEFERMWRLNTFSAFLFSQAVAPLLQEHGALIHIGSVNGESAGRDLGAYKASKAALNMLARCLALELAADPRRIRVNVVSPGWVITPGELDVWAAQGGAEALNEPERLRYIPLGRHTRAEEVADTVAFLVSERGAGITGVVLNVDGGVNT